MVLACSHHVGMQIKQILVVANPSSYHLAPANDDDPAFQHNQKLCSPTFKPIVQCSLGEQGPPLHKPRPSSDNHLTLHLNVLIQSNGSKNEPTCLSQWMMLAQFAFFPRPSQAAGGKDNHCFPWL